MTGPNANGPARSRSNEGTRSSLSETSIPFFLVKKLFPHKFLVFTHHSQNSYFIPQAMMKRNIFMYFKPIVLLSVRY